MAQPLKHGPSPDAGHGIAVSIVGIAVVAVVVSLGACAEMPSGPTVAVMPAPTKPFDVFVQDDELCRGWAEHSIGQAGNDAAAQRMLASTVAGAGIGAIAGAAAGGERGAGTGVAIGTVVGVGAGANQNALSAWGAQRRYDIAYQQCMYSKGDLVPSYGYGGVVYLRSATPVPPPPPSAPTQ
jgi:hypothetical protein